MPEPRVLDIYVARGGMVALVRRVDGSEVTCPLIVNEDGSLGIKRPRGEWLIEPPPQPLVGQEAFADAGGPP